LLIYTWYTQAEKKTSLSTSTVFGSSSVEHRAVATRRMVVDFVLYGRESKVTIAARHIKAEIVSVQKFICYTATVSMTMVTVTTTT